MPEPQVITDSGEVLNRQVPPGLWNAEAGEPMWHAFGPQSRDQGLMSTLRGRVSPAEAHRRHTEDHGLESMGTWGVKVGDAAQENVKCLDDGGINGLPPDHASADFRPLTRGERRAAAAELHSRAEPLYRPEA